MKSIGVGNAHGSVRNVEGYLDPTVCDAVKNIKSDAEIAHEECIKCCDLVRAIELMCDVAGFHIQGKFALRNLGTGKVYLK